MINIFKIGDIVRFKKRYSQEFIGMKQYEIVSYGHTSTIELEKLKGVSCYLASLTKSPLNESSEDSIWSNTGLLEPSKDQQDRNSDHDLTLAIREVFEYKILKKDSVYDFEFELNKLSTQGWELSYFESHLSALAMAPDFYLALLRRNINVDRCVRQIT